jgi:flagellar biosynthesis protein FlhB
MAENAEQADKKHAPSEKGLREAADRGQLPRSTELSGVVSVVAVSSALVLAGAEVAGPIVEFAQSTLAPGRAGDMSVLDATDLMFNVLRTVVLASSPPLFAAAAAALVIGLAQTRFQITTKALETRLDLLNPLPRLQQIFFSRQVFVELAKGLLHVFALGAITGYAIWERIDELPSTASLGAAAQLDLMIDLGSNLIVRAVPVMIGLAIIDYSWSYYQWWNQLRRTDQQVKDEAKEAEGDPMVKAQRRRRARELTSRNAVRQLGEATVLVTNPTHYAVGLRYRHGEDNAPIVVVKGADYLALKLRQEAFRLGIPRVEDRMLARTLFAKVPPGHPIPSELYAAVAKVLAVIYKKRRATVGKAPVRRSGVKRKREVLRTTPASRPVSRGWEG